MIPENLWNIQNLKEDQRIPALTRLLKQFYDILNRGFTPRDNFRGAFLECVFTAANVEISVKHGLAFAPQDFLVTNPSVSMNLYEFSSDLNYIRVKSSAIGSARILVF